MIVFGFLALPATIMVISAFFFIDELLEYEVKNAGRFEVFVISVFILIIDYWIYNNMELQEKINTEKQKAKKAEEDYISKKEKLENDLNREIKKYNVNFEYCSSIINKISEAIQGEYPFEHKTKKYIQSSLFDKFMFVWNHWKNEYNNKAKLLEDEYIRKGNCLQKAYDIKREALLKHLKSSTPFKNSSSLYADAVALVFENERKYMLSKPRPAVSSSEIVKELKKEVKIHAQLYKEMLYRYEFLLDVFPELRLYVEDEETLINMSDCNSLSEFESNRDRAFEYLEKEEWERLGVDARNQLALERYKRKEKSKWVIGIEYEMYIDYILRKNGFRTIPYGIKKGLEDLGRDIIAFKDNHVYVIQCKNWSHNREIHENVVCQIFGTSIEYQIKNNESMFSEFGVKVVPVLYTTTKLSDMAIEFAKRLGVRVIIKEKGEFPMIKCNIGRNGEKIYHLPFDQQYYKVLIEEEKGEFYAWTVKEAVGKGFRRAYKYSGYSNPSI